MKKIHLLIGMVTFMLSIVLLVGCSNTAKSSEAYLVLEINPAIEIVINKNDRVEYVSSLNEDGDLLLSNLDLIDLKIEAAIGLIIEEAVNLGFIDFNADEVVVNLTAVGNDEENDETLGERIKKHINNAFLNRGIRGLAQMKKMAAEIIAEANALGIAPGHLRLIKIAQEANPELTVEEALEMSRRDLIGSVKQEGQQIKEMTQQIRQEFFNAREALRAQYQPQLEELRTQIQDLEAQIEAETDEEVKLDLIADLEVLQAELQQLREEMQAEIELIRNSFKEQIASARQAMHEARQQRIEAHKAAVEAYRNALQENRKAIRDQIEQWKQERNNQGK